MILMLHTRFNETRSKVRALNVKVSEILSEKRQALL